MPTRTLFRRLNEVVEPAIRHGAGNSPAGPGLFVLETTGRSSGRARRVPLLGQRTCTAITATTVRADSQWVRNLEATPDATGGTGPHLTAPTWSPPAPSCPDVARWRGRRGR